MSDGDEVKNGVGAATQDGGDDHGILEGLAGQDVAGSDVLLEEVPDGRADAAALSLLGLGLGGAAAAAGQGQTEGLDGSGHGVGRVHASTGTTAGAGVADDVEALLLVDLAGDVLAVGLEGGDDVDRLAGLGATRLDSTAVDHDTRAVDTAHGNGHTGHVLVTARQTDVGVIPLPLHDRLDTVGDDLTTLQRVTHTRRAHGDAVTDADSVEAVSDEPGFADRVPDEGGQVQQVHVARVALVPDGGDADLGLVHVGLAEPRRVEHGLRGALGLGLGDGLGDLVELVLPAGGGRAKEAAVEGGVIVSVQSVDIGIAGVFPQDSRIVPRGRDGPRQAAAVETKRP